MQTNEFLPVCREDMNRRGIKQLDFLYICGDAYVDHPSFGHAIITRVLEAMGYTVGVVAQPDMDQDDDFLKMGVPRLAVLVSSGNIDSMVNHYTAAKKPRSEDLYSPGGRAGLRPDRAVIAYSRKARALFGEIPIIIGGIEASLRRFSHYDYWDDAVRPSVLSDSGADLLIYGMGERQIREIARHLENGKSVAALRDVRGTCYMANDLEGVGGSAVTLFSHEEVCADKRQYAQAFFMQRENQDYVTGRRLIQCQPRGYLVQNPPARPLTTRELDEVYALPYTRRAHPMYDAAGGVPAIREVEFSITAHRGCFGGCSFCALTYHQGRVISPRSDDSVVAEAQLLTSLPGFKGYIHDVGGPTANFHAPSCEKQQKAGVCRDRQCLHPAPCRNLRVSHVAYLNLLRKLRALPGVKRVFVRSGIRFDYLMADEDDSFFRELVEHHVSGQLKVAPEHVSNTALRCMGKPPHKVYRAFSEKFYGLCRRVGKEQYLVPYLMSSHPGSGMKEAVELAVYLKENGLKPQQVQDFYPTPSTLSTCMYYTGIDPRDGKRVYVARRPEEKAMQRALLQYQNPKNYELVRDALIQAGRADLIGTGPHCLIRPRPGDAVLAARRGAGDRQRESDVRRQDGVGQQKKAAGRKQNSADRKQKNRPRQESGLHQKSGPRQTNGPRGNAAGPGGKGSKATRGRAEDALRRTASHKSKERRR